MQKRILERLKALRLSGTCEWLSKKRQYNEWLDEKGPICLWVHGAPGTGKSVLASTLVEEIESSKSPKNLVIRCFVDDTYGTGEHAHFLLQTLICQLNKQRQPMASDLLMQSNLRSIENPVLSIPLDIFQHHLRRILSSIDVDVGLIFVFDGLDLNEGTKRAVLCEIIRANSSRRHCSRLRCCISSRTPCQPDFLSSHAVQFDLNSEPGVRRDLTEFANSRYSTVRSTISRRWGLSSPDQLCFRAKGNFLWLDFMTRNSHQWIAGDISNIDVRWIPETVNDIYRNALQRSIRHNAGLARMVFSWLVAACRPLTQQELAEAVTIGNVPPSAKGAIPCELNISEICGPLVTVTDEGTVQFVHSSVREYLLSTDAMFSARYTLHEAHVLLAKTCLSYLGDKRNAAEDAILGRSFEQSGISPPASYTSSFLEYAETNWKVHYRLGETASNLLPGMLQCRLNSALNYACEKLDIPRRQRSETTKQTALRFCAFNGFRTLARIYVQMGTPLDRGSCKYCSSPLELAARKNHSQIVSLLLNEGAAVPSEKAINLGTMLLEAAARGSLELVYVLLKHGAAVSSNERDSHMTPLHWAALSGHLDCASLLVDKGADMNAITSVTKETPLHLAALHGHSQVADFLLHRQRCATRGLGVYDSIVQQPAYQAFSEDVMSDDGHGPKTVWEIDGRCSAERELRELESNRHMHVSQRDYQGRTPLHLAASNGCDTVARLLLENGASSETYDHDGLTALQLAVENGQLTTVKLMLTTGANHKAGAKNWGAVLWQASSKGYHSVANLMVWLFYITELSDQPVKWSVLCLAVDSERNTARESLEKVRNRTEQSTRFPHRDLSLRPLEIKRRCEESSIHSFDWTYSGDRNSSSSIALSGSPLTTKSFRRGHSDNHSFS